jgi:hypothetical protein
MSDAQAAAKRILEHDAKATPGPWEWNSEHSDTWEMRSLAKPDSVIGYGESCFLPDEEFANGAFIADVRSDAPVVARVYQEAIEALRRLTASEFDVESGEPIIHIVVSGADLDEALRVLAAADTKENDG